MLQRVREARKNESGFTLIELLIVIVILGVLAGIVVFAVSGITDRGKASACAATVKTVQVAGEAYYAKNGVYADTTDALVQAGFLQGPDPVGINYDPSGKQLVVTAGTTGICAQ